jgi:hypothetical protein
MREEKAEEDWALMQVVIGVMEFVLFMLSINDLQVGPMVTCRLRIDIEGLLGGTRTLLGRERDRERATEPASQLSVIPSSIQAHHHLHSSAPA